VLTAALPTSGNGRPDKPSGKRKQKEYVEYGLDGYTSVDGLIKEEQA